jgi:type IX secretion system PorP/SprF family membrane protein
MKTMGIRSAAICLMMSASALCHAQQQPMFTQYMFNGLVINPAYAGSQETFTATAVMRKQWAGMEGAPETQTLSAHSPLDDLRTTKRPGSPVSVGVTIFRDRIAITGHTGLLASYAYRIKFLNQSSLSFGLQGGISQYRIRYSELGLDDPSFAVGDVQELQPEFGAGLYFQSNRFYSGFSAPQMLRPRSAENVPGIAVDPHFFFTTGYVFDVNTTIKVKPNILVKNYQGHLSQIDVNCNVFLNEILNVGVSWRSLESISGLFQLQVNPKFAFGYAYDHPFGADFARLSNGSHEIMLNYRVPKKKIRTINPRFF